MTQTRRQFVLGLFGAALAGMQIPVAHGDSYPSRMVQMVVGFPAGGPLDMVARVTAQWLTQRLGQPFIVENRPGAGGNVGTESVVRAAPDGYTLLVCGPVNTINTSLYEKLSFNFSTDIAPVAGIVRVPLVMVVSPSVAAHTVQEFITYAKAHPGEINVASGGNGTPQHVAAELFKMLAEVDMVHIPYRGSALALNDLFGGQVQVMFEAMPAVIGHINSGKLHALAVTTSERSPVLPDLPAVAEFVPEFDAYSWYGLAAPSRTPPEIIALLNKQINAALGDDKFKARLEALGGTVLGGSAEDLGRLVAVETNKWRKVIRAAHIKLD